MPGNEVIPWALRGNATSAHAARAITGLPAHDGTNAVNAPAAARPRNGPGASRTWDRTRYRNTARRRNDAEPEALGIDHPDAPWRTSRAHGGAGHGRLSDFRMRMEAQTREKSRPFQAQSLRMTVAGPHDATGRLNGQSIVSSRPLTKANP
jgi:hypothetical protein